jgi:hypothetical protein
MSPEGDQILKLSAERLGTTIAPRLSDGFSQATIGLVNFMLGLVAAEYERGADIRVAENNDIREAFAELTPIVTDNALKAKLAHAAREKDISFKISALNAANYALRRLLTELHMHVEEQDGPKARAAEKRIWLLLRAIAARRIVTLG